EVEQTEGVTKIEALCSSLGLIQYVFSLSGGTTSICQPYFSSLPLFLTVIRHVLPTSSFSSHAIIGTITVATQMITGIAKPFIARLAGLTSRPTALTISVALYRIGYIVVASSKTVSDVCGGQVLYTAGNAGIDFLMNLLIADITSLEWRGLATGLTSLPWIINSFVAGYISTGISANTDNGWRWDYGIFTILVPVTTAPAIFILYWANHQAKMTGKLVVPSRSRDTTPEMPLFQKMMHSLSTMDALGLILLATSFILILLPFTLHTTAKNGWKNPLLITMFVVGGILLIAFGLWEAYGTSHPMIPRRVINRTLVCSTLIDITCFMSAYISDTYFWSWVYVVKDWDVRQCRVLPEFTETVGLCVFGFAAGLIQRVTHRYKYFQVTGLCIRIIGMGLNFYAVNAMPVLVSARIILSMGGACSSIGSTVAAQASVLPSGPSSRDMALAMSLLQLWTYVGGSIGSAAAAEIWDDRLPKNLEKYLGDTLNSTQLAEIYGSITVARLAEPRELVIKAYNETAYFLVLPALIISFLPLAAGLLTSNFYLGKTHNAIENKVLSLSQSKEEKRVMTEEK
ncbi:hypothetical protein C8J57DRAFT_1072986, partial [Mycena rebaudengoi]